MRYLYIFFVVFACNVFAGDLPAPPKGKILDKATATGTSGIVSGGRTSFGGGNVSAIKTLDTVSVTGVRPDGNNEDYGYGYGTIFQQPCAGNPINFSNGNKVESELDFATQGEMPLYFERMYSHYSAAIGLLGRHWRTNFDYKLSFDSDLTSSKCYPEPGNLNACSPIPTQPTTIYSHRPDGRIVKFNWDVATSAWWEEKASPIAKIVKNANGTYTHTTEENETETYSNMGYVQKVQNEAGISWTFTYTNYYLTKVQHSSGRSVNFTWSGNKLLTATDPAGNVYSYTYLNNRFGTNLHLLSTVSRPGLPATATTYHYEDSRYLGGLTGKSINGIRYSTFAFDAAKRAILSKHSGDVDMYQFSYTGAGSNVQTATITNPLGKQSTFAFSTGGKIISTTGAASTYCVGSYKETTYDANGYPDLQADFENGMNDYDFNAKGQIIKETKKDATYGDRVFDYTWDTARNRIIKVVQPGVSEINYTYATNNRIASRSVKNLSAQGTLNQTLSTSYTYTQHANGMLSSIIEDGPIPGSGDAITTNFDALGNVTSITDANGALQTYSGYNALGLPSTVTQREGASSGFVYDARGRVTSTSRTVNGQTVTATYTYDGFGNVSQVTGPETTVNSNYNVAGRLLDVITDVESSGTWPESVTTSNQRLFGYNLNGDVTSVQGNRKTTTIVEGLDDGQPTTITHDVANVFSAYTDFDELGRVRAKRGNNGQNTGITYDRENRIKTVKDAANNTTTLTYNAHGEVISSTDALGAVTTFAYNSAGDLTQVNAPNGAITQYVYDGLGLLRQQISPDTGTTTYSYNTYAQLSQVTRADGGGLAYSYDGQGRISQIVASRPGLANVTRTYSYDTVR